jgi:bifunctional DNA-binding transcriptional regulator/antitoxin component of YhaV-PrlF toxin-antitoxin module
MSNKVYRIIGNEGRVTIPHQMRLCAGMVSNTIVSFEMVSEDTVLVRREQLKNRADFQTEMPSLKELLEGLTESQRSAAQCYLAILCSANGESKGMITYDG